MIATLSATIGDARYSGQTLNVPSEGTTTAGVRSYGPVTVIKIRRTIRKCKI